MYLLNPISILRRSGTLRLILLVAILGFLAYKVATQHGDPAAVNAISSVVEVATAVLPGHPGAVLAGGAAALGILAATQPSTVDAGTPDVNATAHPRVEIRTPLAGEHADMVTNVRATTQVRAGPRYRYYVYVVGRGTQAVASELHWTPGSPDVIGTVTLGNAAVGAGLHYTIQVVGSPQPLEIGSSIVPTNVIRSAPVDIVRRPQ
jgi:hypothetical protein